MRILVVDDDPDFRVLGIRALQREFPNDLFVGAGDREALDRALAADPVPGLLVSDLSLRWADGFEVLNIVRARAPDCPAIMFTNTGNEELAVRAIKAGFDDYLVKSPKQFQRLAAAARLAVSRAETRRGLEENQDLLIQELYHRLHNNLQLVIGLISFTARGLVDAQARARLLALGQRVQALSALQERLYRGGDFRRVGIEGVVRAMADELLPVGATGVGTTFDIDDVALPVDLALPVALIINELITNAVKHAFGPHGGRLWVTFKQTPDPGYMLQVADDGSKGGAAPLADGLGMRLVRRLAQQVGSEFEVKPREGGGTLCQIRIRDHKAR